MNSLECCQTPGKMSHNNWQTSQQFMDITWISIAWMTVVLGFVVFPWNTIRKYSAIYLCGSIWALLKAWRLLVCNSCEWIYHKGFYDNNGLQHNDFICKPRLPWFVFLQFWKSRRFDQPGYWSNVRMKFNCVADCAGWKNLPGSHQQQLLHYTVLTLAPNPLSCLFATIRL